MSLKDHKKQRALKNKKRVRNYFSDICNIADSICSIGKPKFERTPTKVVRILKKLKDGSLGFDESKKIRKVLTYPKDFT